MSKLSEQMDMVRQYRSEKSARSFYDSVHEAAAKLSRHPQMGRLSDIEGVRSIGIALDFRIYYTIEKGDVYLLTLHSTRANPDDNPFE